MKVNNASAAVYQCLLHLFVLLFTLHTEIKKYDGAKLHWCLVRMMLEPCVFVMISMANLLSPAAGPEAATGVSCCALCREHLNRQHGRRTSRKSLVTKRVGCMCNGTDYDKTPCCCRTDALKQDVQKGYDDAVRGVY